MPLTDASLKSFYKCYEPNIQDGCAKLGLWIDLVVKDATGEPDPLPEPTDVPQAGALNPEQPVLQDPK